MVIYPNMILLDLVGPQTVFAILQADVRLVWKDKRPVSTDVGVPMVQRAHLKVVPTFLTFFLCRVDSVDKSPA
jgi:hypothetical protein